MNFARLCAPQPSDKLEDGTVSFLDIISLKHGFNMIRQLGGIQRIQAHVASLTEWTYNALTRLKHSNGAPMAKVFGKHALDNHRQVRRRALLAVLWRVAPSLHVKWRLCETSCAWPPRARGSAGAGAGRHHQL